MLLSTQCSVLLAGWSYVCVCLCVCVCVLNRSTYVYSTVYLSSMLIDRQMPQAKYPSVSIHTPGPLQTLRAAVHARFQIFMVHVIHVVASCGIKICRYAAMIRVNLLPPSSWYSWRQFFPHQMLVPSTNTDFKCRTSTTQFSWLFIFCLIISLQIKQSSHGH